MKDTEPSAPTPAATLAGNDVGAGVAPRSVAVLGRQLQRSVGNAATLRALAGARPRFAARALQRANIVLPSGGQVGDQVGPGVNRVRDVGPLLDRLHVIWAITNDQYSSQVKALAGKGGDDIVALGDLGPLLEGLRRASEGSVAPAVATALFGIELTGPVGPGLANAPADLATVVAALTAEGIAATADAASVQAGLAEVKRRIMIGSRPLRPVAIVGDTKAFVDSLFKERSGPGGTKTRLLDEGSWRLWPVLLRPPARAQLTPEQIQAITGKVGAARAAVALRADVHIANPYGNHPGLSYTRPASALLAGAEPNPTGVGNAAPAAGAPAESPRERIGRLAWREVLTEGSAASLNAWDPQLLTVGRGFGMQGDQGRNIMRDALARDAGARDRLLDAGFAMDGTTALALDLPTATVVSGDAALHHVELDRIFGSQFASTFEDPAHMQGMVDAQYEQLKRKTAFLSDPQVLIVTTWSDESIRFWVHARHFAPGIATWEGGISAAPAGEIMALAQISIRSCPSLGGARRIYVQEDSRFLQWADDAMRKRTTDPTPDELTDVRANIASQTEATAATSAVAQARKSNASNVAALEEVQQAKAGANAAAQRRVEALPAGARFFQTPRGIRKLMLP